MKYLVLSLFLIPLTSQAGILEALGLRARKINVDQVQQLQGRWLLQGAASDTCPAVIQPRVVREDQRITVGFFSAEQTDFTQIPAMGAFHSSNSGRSHKETQCQSTEIPDSNHRLKICGNLAMRQRDQSIEFEGSMKVKIPKALRREIRRETPQIQLGSEGVSGQALVTFLPSESRLVMRPSFSVGGLSAGTICEYNKEQTGESADSAGSAANVDRSVTAETEVEAAPAVAPEAAAGATEQ